MLKVPVIFIFLIWGCTAFSLRELLANPSRELVPGLQSRTRQEGSNCYNDTFFGLGEACGPELFTHPGIYSCKNSLYGQLSCVSTLDSDSTTCEKITSSTPCVEQSDCQSACVNGFCEEYIFATAGEACSNNLSCTSGNCISGFCVAKQLGESCNFQECLPGMYCNPFSRTCVNSIPLGGECGNISINILNTFESAAFYDIFTLCSGGFCDIRQAGVNNYFGNCTKFGSVPEGSEVGDFFGSLFCEKDLFVVEVGSERLCQSSALCDDQTFCSAITESICACSDNINLPGTCVTYCGAEALALYDCVTANNSANGGIFGVQRIAEGQTSSLAYQNCRSYFEAYDCCEFQSSPYSYYNTPGKTCQSSATASSATSGTSAATTGTTTGASATTTGASATTTGASATTTGAAATTTGGFATATGASATTTGAAATTSAASTTSASATATSSQATTTGSSTTTNSASTTTSATTSGTTSTSSSGTSGSTSATSSSSGASGTTPVTTRSISGASSFSNTFNSMMILALSVILFVF